MSFSARIKEELAHLPIGRACCAWAELYALLYTTGTLSQSTLERVARLNQMHFGVASVELSGDDARRVIMACEVEEGMAVCCRAAFLRGAFLGGGSCVNPEKAYHLEIVSGDNRLIKLMAELNLQARKMMRKGLTVVYLKEAEQIAEFLTHIGAGGARCAFEDVRILKELRNQVNRATNCDSANMDKALEAAYRQISMIEDLERHVGLDVLPAPLRETAEKRRTHPEMSLMELGACMNPPLGKSGVNHRLKRIETYLP